MQGLQFGGFALRGAATLAGALGREAGKAIAKLDADAKARAQEKVPSLLAMVAHGILCVSGLTSVVVWCGFRLSSICMQLVAEGPVCQSTSNHMQGMLHLPFSGNLLPASVQGPNACAGARASCDAGLRGHAAHAAAAHRTAGTVAGHRPPHGDARFQALTARQRRLAFDSHLEALLQAQSLALEQARKQYTVSALLSCRRKPCC